MLTPKEQQLLDFAHYINSHPEIMILYCALIVWTLVWKGIALWKSAKNNSAPWFVVLLLVNTVGILEILYIFFFSKKKAEEQ